MRAITADLKVLVGRLGPLVGKALEGAIRRAVSAEHPEVTTDHLLRALLDLPDSDLCVSMENAHLPRKDVVARLDWHLGRLHGKHEGKPRLSHALCLLLDDAGKLTTDRVRSGHITSALLADPSLSGADIGKVLDGLPRLSLHLLASRVEDRGEVGRLATAPAPAAEPGPITTSLLDADRTPVSAAPADKASAPAAAAPAEKAPSAAPAEKAPSGGADTTPVTASPSGAAPVTSGAPAVKSPTNIADLRAIVVDRLVSEDARGLTLTAHVEGRETTLRLEWDADQRVLAVRITLPGSPPADAVRTAVALSTLNNALPHGAFIAEGDHLAFRSHVFLDEAGNAPLETVVFAIRTCQEAAEAML